MCLIGTDMYIKTAAFITSTGDEFYSPKTCSRFVWNLVTYRNLKVVTK